MTVKDPGHDYELNLLDDSHDGKAFLRFVKRNTPQELYPGNVDAHSGTTLQEVFRACIDRCHYVNNQEYSGNTARVITLLRASIMELELRAAERHGRKLLNVRPDIENEPTCSDCGHIHCNKTCRTSETSDIKEK